MRFAILSPIYPYRGGIAQFSGMLYTELVKEGHEVKGFQLQTPLSGYLISRQDPIRRSGRPCDRDRERASIR